MRINPDKNHKCSVCGLYYRGFGNNARPVNSGRCCDECNATEVIPARFAAIYGYKVKAGEDE